jgi:hypothetical protein
VFVQHAVVMRELKQVISARVNPLEKIQQREHIYEHCLFHYLFHCNELGMMKLYLVVQCRFKLTLHRTKKKAGCYASACSFALQTTNTTLRVTFSPHSHTVDLCRYAGRRCAVPEEDTITDLTD